VAVAEAVAVATEQQEPRLLEAKAERAEAEAERAERRCRWKSPSPSIRVPRTRSSSAQVVQEAQAAAAPLAELPLEPLEPLEPLAPRQPSRQEPASRLYASDKALLSLAQLLVAAATEGHLAQTAQRLAALQALPARTTRRHLWPLKAPVTPVAAASEEQLASSGRPEAQELRLALYGSPRAEGRSTPQLPEVTAEEAAASEEAEAEAEAEPLVLVTNTHSPEAPQRLVAPELPGVTLAQEVLRPQPE
jgi:hypothetical protein